MTRLLTILLLTLFAAKAAAVPIQLYGLNYNTRHGPDWDYDKCKNREEVLTDLTTLQKMTSRIRILSLTDCRQGELVLDVAKQLGLQLWLGLWVSQYEDIFLGEMAALQDMFDRGLIDSTVLGISVGSESIYRKEVNVSQIIEYRDQVKEQCVNAGFSDLPVSICDIAPVYEGNPQLISAVDVVVVNSFPFWENVAIEDSTDYLLSEINPIISQAAAENKGVILGETGWPSEGYNPDVAEASPELQTEYFTRFFCLMDRELNWEYYYFSGIDADWRLEQDPNNTLEGSWGFLYGNLTLKPHFQDLSFSCSDSSVQYTFSEIDWTIPVYTAQPTISPAPISGASCEAHSGCEGLGGNCCPTDNGDYLGCCGTTSPSNATDETETPAVSPTASPSTAVPTASPSTATPMAEATNAPTDEFPTESDPMAPATSPSATNSPTVASPLSSSLPTFLATLGPPTLEFETSNGSVARHHVILTLILCSLLVLF